jgi:sporulation protein YlmC with PRC-barrel domain
MEIVKVLEDHLASYGLSYMLEGKEVVDTSGDIIGIVRDITIERKNNREPLFFYEIGEDRARAVITADEVAAINERIFLS